MATTTIKLDFKKNEWSPPSVHIYVVNHGTLDGKALLSADLADEQNFDKWINLLKSELEQVRIEGKKKFQQLEDSKIYPKVSLLGDHIVVEVNKENRTIIPKTGDKQKNIDGVLNAVKRLGNSEIADIREQLKSLFG